MKDADRQRALSYWSFGSWGGAGIASFAGGSIATYLGWRYIFVFSIVFTLISMYLIKDVPENKGEQSGSSKFDIRWICCLYPCDGCFKHGHYTRC